MNFFKRLFGKENSKAQMASITLDLNDADKQIISDFASYDDEWRVKEIIILSETADHLYFRLMQYAILYDPNLNVKFAALKRIHLFQDHPDLKTMMLKMKGSSMSVKLEPYFSMALTRLGLISLEEFNHKVNRG